MKYQMLIIFLVFGIFQIFQIFHVLLGQSQAHTVELSFLGHIKFNENIKKAPHDMFVETYQ
jgi:hypothetical protein